LELAELKHTLGYQLRAVQNASASKKMKKPKPYYKRKEIGKRRLKLDALLRGKKVVTLTKGG